MNTNVPSRGPGIVIACIISPIVAGLFLSVRLWTRALISPPLHRLGWDDYAATITMPFCIAYSVLLGISTRYGMGLHEGDMPPALASDYQKACTTPEWIYISSAVYIVSLLGYKIAILLLYNRIFGINRRFRYATYACMFFVSGYLVCNFLTLLFGCRPMSKYWRSEVPGHCIATINADYAYGSLNFVSDLLIFILPLPMVWRLQLSRKGKIGVSLVFASGAIACVVAVIRFTYMVFDLTSTDRTWIAAETFLWSVLEINTGLICSCTPALKPFFKHISERAHRKNTSSEIDDRKPLYKQSGAWGRSISHNFKTDDHTTDQQRSKRETELDYRYKNGNNEITVSTDTKISYQMV